jgi:hypothetical protein
MPWWWKEHEDPIAASREGTTTAVLDATLALSQTQILAQVTDEASLDGRTMGLLAFNAALLGGDIAAKSLLGYYWWTPLVAVGVATVPCLWSVFKKTSAFGPPAREFYERFGGQDPSRGKTQLLADLDDAFTFNAERVRWKMVRLQIALGSLVAGLIVAALLITVVRPTTIRPCAAGRIRVQGRSHPRRYQCRNPQDSPSSVQAGSSEAAASAAEHGSGTRARRGG